MNVDLRVYGNIDEFSLNDAAYLFLDLAPVDENLHEPPKLVSDMQKLLNKELAHFPISDGVVLQAVDPRTGEFYFASAPRSALIQVAEALEMTPKFLFPEARGKGFKMTEANQDDLDPRRKKSYLILIKALCSSKSMFDLTDRETVGKLVKLVEVEGVNLGKNTIRSILKEVQELP